MDIRGHRFGGTFEIQASDAERRDLLDAISENGICGRDRDELLRHPGLGPKVVGAVAAESDWDRRVLELVDATLDTDSKSTDARLLASRALLRAQTSAALAQYPRR